MATHAGPCGAFVKDAGRAERAQVNILGLNVVGEWIPGLAVLGHADRS